MCATLRSACSPPPDQATAIAEAAVQFGQQDNITVVTIKRKNIYNLVCEEGHCLCW
jgi:hypothetical protein